MILGMVACKTSEWKYPTLCKFGNQENQLIVLAYAIDAELQLVVTNEHHIGVVTCHEESVTFPARCEKDIDYVKIGRYPGEQRKHLLFGWLMLQCVNSVITRDSEDVQVKIY